MAELEDLPVMESADAKAMLKEIEKQDDVRVARIIKLRWSDENDDAFMWSINGCSGCHAPGEELVAGTIGYVWGKPTSNDRDCQFVAMTTFCSEECVEAALGAWSDELQCDVYAAWHTFV